MKYHGLDEFRAQLEAAGWVIGIDHMGNFSNECNWYAWHREREPGMPECACNDKTPNFILWPSEYSIQGRIHSGCEVEICGETKSGEWLKLRAYSISVEEFFTKIPLIRRRLAAAWIAGFNVEE